MNVTKWNVRAGAYYDSVVLMQLQRGLLELGGVIDAGVVMATPANRDLLAANDMLPASIEANPDDMLIVVKAESEDTALAALEKVDELLARRKSSGVSGDYRPRSLGAAAKQLPGANVVLVSVPGRYAAGVAREALDLGKHVFLYSDNVTLEEEIALKTTARERSLLVMGPDCGTAILSGTGLGFANRVRRGPVGVVGASGTGTQAVTAHVHDLGAGISHAIGTGGRDLHAEVGAVTAHQALDALARDPDTGVIVLVSKPPAPGVATGLISAAQGCGKPVVVYFIGYPPPGRRSGNLHFATSLREAAELAVDRLAAKSERPSFSGEPARGYLRGLFSGGTLAYESLLGLQATLSPIFSNAPITAEQALPDPLKSTGHTIIDLGEEFFMVGRLHPMIDNDLRIRRMRQEASDPGVGMILFDVVLGEGSHVDPAGELAPVVAELREQRADIEFVSVLIGTGDDPQDIESQVERLESAGVTVFRSATAAIEHVSLRFSQEAVKDFPAVDLDTLNRPLAAINAGLESFYDSLVSQGAQAVHVDWRPPAGGDERVAALLSRLKK